MGQGIHDRSAFRQNILTTLFDLERFRELASWRDKAARRLWRELFEKSD